MPPQWHERPSKPIYLVTEATNINCATIIFKQLDDAVDGDRSTERARDDLLLIRALGAFVCRTGTGQTEAACVAGATHSCVAEWVANNLPVLCTGQRRRAGDEGKGAVLRENACRVLRAGRRHRHVALPAPTCACSTARRGRGELLARNVARQVKMPTGAIRKVTPWSADEARTFLETARHDRLYALWAVALAIGLRRGEALGLRWADVDLVNGRVVVTKALSRGGTDLALRDVKTESSAASVPLPAELVAILRKHRLNQLGDTQVARGNTLGLVFTTTNGTSLEPRNINRRSRLCADELACEASGSTTSGIRARRCCSRWVSRQRQCSAFFVTARFQ